MTQKSAQIVRWMARLAGVGMLVTVGAWFMWKPLSVEAHRVVRGTLVAEVLGTGTLEARVKTTISSKISGRIRELLVDEGERVTAGQLLVRLDDVELSQLVEVARANEAAARAGQQRRVADQQRAAAILAQAKQNDERMIKLRQANVITPDELEKATEALAIAQAGTAQAAASFAEGEKQLVAAEKALQSQQARLNDARITAPIDGLIVTRARDPGDVVVPGGAILTLIATDTLWVSAWVDETEIATLKVAQAARIVFRSEPQRSYPGRVARLGRETDRETREFVVDVSLLELPSQWAVGQRADVFIETDRRESTLVIPSRCVIWKRTTIASSASTVPSTSNTPGVVVIQSDRAAWRPIELGQRSREAFEVLSGLSADELVFVPTESQRTLIDGQRVMMP